MKKSELKALLDAYDTRKGVIRNYITGDTEEIQKIRDLYMKKPLKDLQEEDEIPLSTVYDLSKILKISKKEKGATFDTLKSIREKIENTILLAKDEHNRVEIVYNQYKALEEKLKKKLSEIESRKKQFENGTLTFNSAEAIKSEIAKWESSKEALKDDRRVVDNLAYRKARYFASWSMSDRSRAGGNFLDPNYTFSDHPSDSAIQDRHARIKIENKESVCSQLEDEFESKTHQFIEMLSGMLSKEESLAIKVSHLSATVAAQEQVIAKAASTIKDLADAYGIATSSNDLRRIDKLLEEAMNDLKSKKQEDSANRPSMIFSESLSENKHQWLFDKIEEIIALTEPSTFSYPISKVLDLSTILDTIKKGSYGTNLEKNKKITDLIAAIDLRMQNSEANEYNELRNSLVSTNLVIIILLSEEKVRILQLFSKAMEKHIESIHSTYGSSIDLEKLKELSKIKIEDSDKSEEYFSKLLDELKSKQESLESKNADPTVKKLMDELNSLEAIINEFKEYITPLDQKLSAEKRESPNP